MSAYDPARFAVVLRKAIGDRTVKQFAKEADMSRFQVSRRLSCRLQTPPRKKTLSRIASVAQGGVTYEQLLLACGYKPVTEPNMPQKISADEIKLAKACILSSISDLGISCSISAKPPQVPCDFEIIMDSDPPLCWDFTCIPTEAGIITAEQILDKNYLSLMYNRLQAYSKLSFVTGSQEIFSLCMAKKPVNLNANVSVILCQTDTLEILGEQDLSVSNTAPLPEGKYTFNNSIE